MIPLATTTVTIERPAADGDPYESTTWTTVATDIDAHISAPTGAERIIGGQQSEIDATLLVDTTDLRHQDRITDDGTDETYGVSWVRQRQGLGLGHTVAGLKVFQGASSG